MVLIFEHFQKHYTIKLQINFIVMLLHVLLLLIVHKPSRQQ